MGSSCSSGPKKDKKKKSREANGGNHSRKSSETYVIVPPSTISSVPPSSSSDGMAGPSTSEPASAPAAAAAATTKASLEHVDSVSSPMSPNQLPSKDGARGGGGGAGGLSAGATSGGAEEELECGLIDLASLTPEIRGILNGSELRRLIGQGQVVEDSEDRDHDVFQASNRCISVVLSSYDTKIKPEELCALESSVMDPLKKVASRRGYEVQWLVLLDSQGEWEADWGWLFDEASCPLTVIVLVTSESSPPPPPTPTGDSGNGGGAGESCWSWLANKIISSPSVRKKSLVIWKRLLQSQFETTQQQQKLLETMDEARILKVNLKHEEQDTEEYLQRVRSHLWSTIAPIFDMMIEENERRDPTALSQPKYIGLSHNLYLELVNQYRLAQSFLRCFNCGPEESGECLWPKEFLQKIDTYLWGPSGGEGKSPLVLHGSSGKSCLMAQLAYRLANDTNSNAAHIVFRLIAHRHQPQPRFSSLFNNLIEQCCLLLARPKPNSIQAIDLPGLLGRIPTPDIPLIVLLDGLDSVVMSSPSSDWLPKTLPPNVHLIITMDNPSLLRDYLAPEAFLTIPIPLPDVASKVIKARLEDKQITLNQTQQLVCDDAVRLNPSVSSISIIVKSIELLLLQGRNSSSSLEFKSSLEMQCTALLESLEKELEPSFISASLTFLLLAKHGVSQAEMATLLTTVAASPPPPLSSSSTQVIKSFQRLTSWLEPAFISVNVHQQTSLYSLNCPHLRAAIRQRYVTQLPQMQSRWTEFWKSKEDSRRKMAEFSPLSHDERLSILEPSYILNKFKYSNVEDLILELQESASKRAEFKPEDVEQFIEFLKEAYLVLNYDGGEFLTQVHGRFSLPNKQSVILDKIFDSFIKPGALCNSFLSPLGLGTLRLAAASEEEAIRSITSIHRVKNKPGFMVSLNANDNEVIVWNAYEQRAVRTYVGVPQPRDIKFIDEHRALILCNRELCIYDLDEGKFLVKLKGVMNQKMAFYGLHNSEHVVALSRNRMYVNMLNLSSGDCVATFKVGEDRFLNSLLVSADGSICVCGDETQKPFPLLVWDLASRKLMYDLRIPHHDFVTSLSAITSDGHYVICVCQEVSDPIPNFVIVYDLQNGTLFKKWKPEVSTCSVAISSEGGCAITGLTNTALLVWDLITGACKFTLIGHTAPVTCIQLDEKGQRCLTADLPRCRDPAIRLWDLTKGLSLASFMSADSFITCCQLSLDGQYVAMSLSDRSSILTLMLVESGSTVKQLLPREQLGYGEAENDGKSVNFTAQK